jgi:hypothetical protein
MEYLKICVLFLMPPDIPYDFESIPVEKLDSAVNSRVWRAFLEGLELPYIPPTRGTVVASMLSAIEIAQVTPIRVAQQLGMNEQYVASVINGSYRHPEKARELGVLIKNMQKPVREKAPAISISPSVACMLLHLSYEEDEFRGMNVKQAVERISEKEGMTHASLAQAMGLSQRDLHDSLSRADKSEKSADFLGKKLNIVLNGITVQGAIKPESVHSPAPSQHSHEMITGSEIAVSLTTPVVAAEPALHAAAEPVLQIKPETQSATVVAKPKGYCVSPPPDQEMHEQTRTEKPVITKPQDGEFPKWVRSLNRNPKELARKWCDRFNEPLFTPEQIAAMREGIFVPSDVELVRIVQSQGIKNVPVQKKLYEAVREQRGLLGKSENTIEPSR